MTAEGDSLTSHKIISTFRPVLHARVTKKNRQTNSLHVSSSRWRAYGAAGVTSALGNAGSAEAEIHYSGVLNHAFAGNHPLSTANFPLIGSAHLHFFRIANGSGGGTAGFTIPGSGSLLGSSVGAFAGSLPQPGNVYLSRLASGVNVSQLRFKNSCHSKTYGDVSCYGAVIGRLDTIHGGFKRAGKGFIAFVFDTADGPQYGWARIKTRGAPEYRFILVDYAYADPDESIQAGQKHSSEQTASIPKSGSVALLALGNAGLLAWRNRRTNVIAP